MCAVPNMAVFCSSFTSCFPGTLLTYFLNNFQIVSVDPITRITFSFTFHKRCISIVRSLYFRIFSASFLITFLSPETATSINIHVPISLSRIMSGLLLGIVLQFVRVYYYYYYYIYRLYTGYLQLCTWNKPRLYGKHTMFSLYCGYDIRYTKCYIPRQTSRNFMYFILLLLLLWAKKLSIRAEFCVCRVVTRQNFDRVGRPEFWQTFWS